MPGTLDMTQGKPTKLLVRFALPMAAGYACQLLYTVADSMVVGRLIGVGAQLLFLAKNLERIGDHSTHIAEMVFYMVTGTSLGDDRPKGEPTGIDFIRE